ncbi:helix-turn-helix transcriptional regulator [Piscirickettsia salmonis]|uniref:helix-turn-helix transcriptional regulator n=1 Tax=Piscirickettsia salmonis TaxID=1238 RepID=UPI003A804F64
MPKKYYKHISNFIDNNQLIRVKLSCSGNIEDYNSLFLDIFKIKYPGNISAKNFFELCQEHDIENPIPQTITDITAIKSTTFIEHGSIHWQLNGLICDSQKISSWLLSGRHINHQNNKETININKLFKGKPYPVYIKNLSGYFIYANKVTNQLAGKNIIGSTDYDLIWSNDAGYFAKNDAIARENSYLVVTESTLCVSQLVNIFISTKLALKDQSNKVIGTLNFSIPTKIIPPSRSLKLSSRELECIHWLTLGKSPEKIATTIGISKRTVENHIAMIKAKFKCRTQVELGYALGKLHHCSLI